MTELSKGGNVPWSHPNVALQVAGLPAGGSVLAFLVTGTGKVRSDDDFVFFNNPTVPGVAVLDHSAEIDLDQVPDGIDRIVVAAVQDDADPAPLSAQRLQVTVYPDRLEVPVTGLSTERAVVLVEVYRRADQWKLRNVSAGWTEGFSALVRAHGVDVDDAGPAADPPATASTAAAAAATPAPAPAPPAPA